jgi:ABC-type multidrug transport system ATPase subunit
VLSAKNLGKRLGSRWLFRNLEFELGVGDALLITGPNGSGKSTLLRCLCGLDSLSEGSVNSGPVGLAAIDQAVYPDLTCQEHIDLMVDLRGTGDRNALDLVNLKYAGNLPAQKLSSGMRARLKLAMAVLHAPTVLLLDEPSATLDAPGIALVENLIAEQLKRGCLIIATNDPNERRLANQEISLEV